MLRSTHAWLKSNIPILVFPGILRGAEQAIEQGLAASGIAEAAAFCLDERVFRGVYARPEENGKVALPQDPISLVSLLPALLILCFCVFQMFSA